MGTGQPQARGAAPRVAVRTVEEADSLTRFARKVYLIHRRREFRVQPIVQERVRGNPEVQGVFVFIGFTLNAIKEHARHDQGGFFLTDERMQTSVPGLFAAGDIRAQPVRQITNAVADGTVAAIMAQKYLEERPIAGRT